MITMLSALQIITELRARVRGEDGLETVEYALIAALVAVVAITTVAGLGGQIDAVFKNISDAITGAGVGVPAPASG